MTAISNLMGTKVMQKPYDQTNIKNLAEGQPMQVISQTLPTDKVELSPEGVSKSDEIQQLIIEKPRSWTIDIELLESVTKNIKEAVEKATKLNLGSDFIRAEGEKWATDLCQNDPELFARWLTFNKDRILYGRIDLVSLPRNFKREDYYSYVGKNYSAYA